MRRSPRQYGYTMVELLLYVTLLGGMVTVISLFITQTLQARVKSETVSEVEQQGNQVLHTILQVTRNAQTITAPTTGTTAATSTIDVTAVADDPTIFDLSSGQIRIKEGTDAAIPLTNTNVTASALTFSNLTRASTPGILRVQFTLSRVNTSGRNEYDYTKTFYGTASLRQP